MKQYNYASPRSTTMKQLEIRLESVLDSTQHIFRFHSHSIDSCDRNKLDINSISVALQYQNKQQTVNNNETKLSLKNGNELSSSFDSVHMQRVSKCP